MVLIKCKMCGGQLNIEPDLSVQPWKSINKCRNGEENGV